MKPALKTPTDSKHTMRPAMDSDRAHVVQRAAHEVSLSDHRLHD